MIKVFAAIAGKYLPTSIPCYSTDFSQLWLGIVPAFFLQLLVYFLGLTRDLSQDKCSRLQTSPGSIVSVV